MKNSFEIKNVKTFQGHDGIGLNCTVYANGKRAFEYFDDARGGEGEIRRVLDRDAFKAIEDHIKIQPLQTSENFPGLEIKYDVDQFVNDLLEQWEKAKFERAKQKKMQTCIVIDAPDGNGYRYYKFPRNLELIPVDLLKQHVAKIQGELKPGEKIANTNLPTA